MARRADAGGLVPIVGVVAAVLLLGATAGSWVEEPVTRAVRDVTVWEVRAASGVEFSPSALVAALAGLGCSFALLLTSGRARRVVALLTSGVGLWALISVGTGIVTVLGRSGAPTAAPWLAFVGGAGMLATGLVGLRRPTRRMPARYDVDVPPDDAEWQIASDPAGEDADAASYPDRT